MKSIVNLLLNIKIKTWQHNLITIGLKAKCTKTPKFVGYKKISFFFLQLIIDIKVNDNHVKSESHIQFF